MKTNWNLKLLSDKPIKDLLKIESEESLTLAKTFFDKWSNKRVYMTDIDKLFDSFMEFEQLQDKLYRFSSDFYIFLCSALDQNDDEVKMLSRQASDLNTKIHTEYLQFYLLSISKLDIDMQTKLLSDTRFSHFYKYFADIFFQAKYTLSEKEEKIMALYALPSKSNWVELTENELARDKYGVIIDGVKTEKTFVEIQNLISDNNKENRDRASVVLNNILDKVKHIATAEINSLLYTKKISDELRGFSRPDSSKIMNDDITEEFIDALRSSVISRYDISKRYYKLKAKLMNVDKLGYHERNVPILTPDIKYNFEDGIKLCSNVFQNIDPIYNEIFKDFLDKGQIDVYPKLGKMDGAFCTHNGKYLPVMVLLNHTTSISNVTTIAHEMGHAFNHVLMNKNSNSIMYSGMSLSIAEVASNFFEGFILKKLIEDNPEYELGLKLSALNDEVSSIMRQIACYNFEYDLHSKFRTQSYLSVNEVGEIFLKNMSAYMGDSVSMDKGSENWWVYWSHIRNNFYVYSYASGLLISKSMQSMYKSGELTKEKLIEFLSSDESTAPVQTFAKIGIDIYDKSFWEKGLVEMENLLNECEKLADNIYSK